MTLVGEMQGIYGIYNRDAQSSGRDGLIEIRDYTEATWAEGRRDSRDSRDSLSRRIPALYRSLNETNTVYLKAGMSVLSCQIVFGSNDDCTSQPCQVDDDIVFLARHALAEMVREKLRRRCMFVSANVAVLHFRYEPWACTVREGATLCGVLIGRCVSCLTSGVIQPKQAACCSLMLN